MPQNEKKRFLLRIDGELFDTLEKWAANELRSVNGQIEYLLQEAARKSGRVKGTSDRPGAKESRPRS